MYFSFHSISFPSVSSRTVTCPPSWVRRFWKLVNPSWKCSGTGACSRPMNVSLSLGSSSLYLSNLAKYLSCNANWNLFTWMHNWKSTTMYRGRLYFAQSLVKKDPRRTRQNSLATAGTNFTKPGAQNKGDLCIPSTFQGPVAASHLLEPTAATDRPSILFSGS